ncbi:MAG TPA: aldo/keto reductase [Anaerolineaceae bacterium]|nr:aldo/keto reductase [Anaerolineaceae bacterium]
MTENIFTLGQSSLRVPRMGVGAMVWGQPKGLSRWTPAQMSYGPSDSALEEERALEVCLQAGVNLIDTAEMYSNGASERRVGELARGKEVIIATKFPPTPFSRISDYSKALEASLSRLDRSYIDLYQVHFPSGRLPIPELMNCMADAVEAGKVRAVGVSNFSAEQMRQAHAELAKRGIPLASNQVRYSLLYRNPEVDGVLAGCRELGVTLIAYSPLASGALTGKYSVQKRASGLRRFMPTFRGKAIEAVQPVIDLLRTIGQRYGKSPSQVALRWLIENEIVLPIPGAKNSRQAAENAGALTFSLAPDEVAELSQATRPSG